MGLYLSNTQANMMFPHSTMTQTPGLSCPMEHSYSQGSEASTQSSFTYPDLCSSSPMQELEFLPCQSPFESSYDYDFSPPCQSQYGFADTYPVNSPFVNSIPIPGSGSEYFDPASLATSASSISSSPPVQWPLQDAPLFPDPCHDIPIETTRKSNKHFPCSDCGRAFTRSADLKRHQTSVHYPVFQDCPIADCSRKGHNGFPRKDHLLEHLRAYHHVPVPKRGASKRVAKAQYQCL